LDLLRERLESCRDSEPEDPTSDLCIVFYVGVKVSGRSIDYGENMVCLSILISFETERELLISKIKHRLAERSLQ
jgi:hypothetical protein